METYDSAEASKYDGWVTAMTPDDHAAFLADVSSTFTFDDGMSVLDAGAGTGALCLSLTQIPGLDITALEPCPTMRGLFRKKPTLSEVSLISGFCDSADDRSHFAPQSFDLIACRLLVNGLYDPISAFRNWHHWLRPGGTVIIVEGLFDRSGWTGPWEPHVDSLPLSACRTTATIPYLLEHSGFRIEAAHLMQHTNALPSTRTPRYLVVARRVDGTAAAAPRDK